MMDTVGNKVAKSEIAQIKVVAPNVALKVIDRAIQIHGGAGVSNDFPLAYMYAMQRTLRLADRSEEHTSELQSLMRISYAVFCLKKKKQHRDTEVSTIENK